MVQNSLSDEQVIALTGCVPVKVKYRLRLVHTDGSNLSYVTRLLKNRDGKLSGYDYMSTDLCKTYWQRASKSMVEDVIAELKANSLTPVSLVAEPVLVGTMDLCLKAAALSTIK